MNLCVCVCVCVNVAVVGRVTERSLYLPIPLRSERGVVDVQEAVHGLPGDARPHGQRRGAARRHDERAHGRRREADAALRLRVADQAAVRRGRARHVPQAAGR